MGVFGGTQSYAGSARADQMRFNIAGQTVQGMVLQNVQFTFTQQVNMLYEIGSGNVYYIGGRAQGTASVARIIGPGRAQLSLISTFKNLCAPADLQLDGSAMCDQGSSSGVNYKLRNAVLTSIAGSVNANDVLINEQLQFMFADLDVS